MLNSTPQRCYFSKLTHDLTPGTVGNFVGLAEGNLENKVKPQGTKFYNGPNFTE
jgi:peptidyl-prolyl cis-trans isomerase A (cyclophilin A)